MHASSKLESVFTEIICPNFSNLTIGCIYEHAHICNFNSNYISPLFLQKLSKQSSEQMFLLGDFNIDLVKYESFELVNSFLDTLSSIFLSPQIIFPNRISSLSTLTDNIFITYFVILLIQQNQYLAIWHSVITKGLLLRYSTYLCH